MAALCSMDYFRFFENAMGLGRGFCNNKEYTYLGRVVMERYSFVVRSSFGYK